MRIKPLILLLAVTLVSIITTGYLYWISLSREGPDFLARQDHIALFSNPSDFFCKKVNPILVCAHGGDTEGAPPNSKSAFVSAVDAGVQCLEVDVSRTRDGALVALHDRDLQQLLKKPRKVHELSSFEIQALRWGNGEPVMLVEDVVTHFQALMTCMVLDVKVQEEGGLVLDGDVMAQEVTDLIVRTGCGICVPWAKHDGVVGQLKDILPHQRAGYVLVDRGLPGDRSTRNLLRMPAPEVVAVHYALLSPGLVSAAHKAKKTVFAWTANTGPMMAAALDSAADAIVTNFPRKLQKAIAYRKGLCRGTASKGANAIESTEL